MATRPEETYNPIPVWQGQFPTSLEVAERYSPARSHRIAPAPAQREWATGLRSGLKILISPDHRDQVPLGLESFVADIKKIEMLLPNWDSYHAHPLNTSVERPAIELAIMSNERSNYPTVHPLPTGGLSLRWISRLGELEVDLSPQGTCEALLELRGSDNVELPRGSAPADAKALLVRFIEAG